jgi:hypothetical protein
MSESALMSLVVLDATLTIAGFAALWKLAVKLSAIELKAADDLARFKIEAYEKFASYSAVASMENRVIEAITRLGDRLDRVMDRPSEK